MQACEISLNRHEWIRITHAFTVGLEVQKMRCRRTRLHDFFPNFLGSRIGFDSKLSKLQFVEEETTIKAI